MQEFSVNQTSSIWGDYRELAESQEYLTIAFSPGSTSLQQRWRKNALSANFIADYFATFCPDSASKEDAAPTSISCTTKWQDQVNFIANELLENAMKFCDRSANLPISLTLRLLPNSLVFEVSNALNPHAVAQLQAFIRELLSEDPSKLLLRQLERNAADPHSTGSRLGFLTLMSDYQAKIGWKFEPHTSDISIVTIMVYLNL
ncbi:MAG: slr1658 superfamily regulator [Elainella sp.]